MCSKLGACYTIRYFTLVNNISRDRRTSSVQSLASGQSSKRKRKTPRKEREKEALSLARASRSYKCFLFLFISLLVFSFFHGVQSRKIVNLTFSFFFTPAFHLKRCATARIVFPHLRLFGRFFGLVSWTKFRFKIYICIYFSRFAIKQFHAKLIYYTPLSIYNIYIIYIYFSLSSFVRCFAAFVSFSTILFTYIYIFFFVIREKRSHWIFLVRWNEARKIEQSVFLLLLHSLFAC